MNRIYPRPLLLAFHFYAVALYSIFLLFRKATIFDYPRTAIRGFDVLAKACVVFIPVVISELLP
jgi:squalene monooxygenase